VYCVSAVMHICIICIHILIFKYIIFCVYMYKNIIPLVLENNKYKITLVFPEQHNCLIKIGLWSNMGPGHSVTRSTSPLL